jgi:hypothetical protein
MKRLEKHRNRRYDCNSGTGPVAITADYLETVIVRT